LLSQTKSALKTNSQLACLTFSIRECNVKSKTANSFIVFLGHITKFFYFLNGLARDVRSLFADFWTKRIRKYLVNKTRGGS